MLKLIGAQGKFSFGYNSEIISGDSLVTLSIKSASVKRVLDNLLTGKYIYKEKGDYLIIQRAPHEKYYQINGQILDAETGKEVDYASVYSKEQLLSALTDDWGSFRIRLRDRAFPLTLHISKIGYADTSIVILSEINSAIRVSINPKAVDLDTLTITNANDHNSWLAKLFVSSRLRAQSRNLSKFFVSLPFQASLTPGLSTHGRMSSQITNKVSVNIYGGYTAGVNGVELGGLFNISKNDSRYLQMATTFNAVSGNFTGLQASGIYNQVLDSFRGMQLSGIAGVVNQKLNGIQLSAMLNFVAGNMVGTQLALGSNIAKGDVSGLQMSGLGNITGRNLRGLQLGGINYAKNSKGIQVGIVNLADSSSGFGIGLFNIVKHGKGTISVQANELVPLNVTWKSGSNKLYNIFTAGTSLDRDRKAYLFGFGFGREFELGKNLKFAAEGTHQNVYLGKWENRPILYRLQTGLHIKLSEQFSLTGGPSISLLTSRQTEFRADYQSFADKGFFPFQIRPAYPGLVGMAGRPELELRTLMILYVRQYQLMD